MNIQEYTEQLQRRYKTGISQEHSYRGDLQTLLHSPIYYELTIEEIQHYQKIIVALMETDRIMREIDGVFEIT